jgi:hypothetical protein
MCDPGPDRQQPEEQFQKKSRAELPIHTPRGYELCVHTFTIDEVIDK